MRCTLHRLAMRSRSNLHSLACKQAYRLASFDYVAFGSNRSGGRRPHPSWSTSRNKSRPWRVYHQNGVLYFTNTTWCISSSRRGYTMKRDEIQPKGLMIYTSLRVVMICQVCDLDKKIPRTKFSVFLGGPTRTATLARTARSVSRGSNSRLGCYSLPLPFES